MCTAQGPAKDSKTLEKTRMGPDREDPSFENKEFSVLFS